MCIGYVVDFQVLDGEPVQYHGKALCGWEGETYDHASDASHDLDRHVEECDYDRPGSAAAA